MLGDDGLKLGLAPLSPTARQAVVNALLGLATPTQRRVVELAVDGAPTSPREQYPGLRPADPVRPAPRLSEEGRAFPRNAREIWQNLAASIDDARGVSGSLLLVLGGRVREHEAVCELPGRSRSYA